MAKRAVSEVADVGLTLVEPVVDSLVVFGLSTPAPGAAEGMVVGVRHHSSHRSVVISVCRWLWSKSTVPASTYQYGGRLQIVATGQVINPQWTLECSQDTAQTFWFQMPVIAVPSLSPGLSDIPPSFAAYYDISGLSSGGTCRFGLGVTTGTSITGNVQVYAMIG